MKKVCLLTLAMCVGMGIATYTASAAIIVTDPGDNWAATPATANPGNTMVDILTGQSTVHSVGVPGGTSTGVQLSGGVTGNGIADDLVYTTTTAIPPALAATGINLINEGVFGVEFDFYAASDVPNALSLYFFAGTYSWYYSLATPTSGAWTHYTVILGNPGWYSDDGGGIGTPAFLNAIAGNTIDQAGLRIEYPLNSGPFDLGIGNFEYHDSDSYYIPEPGTYMMLSTALMSLGYTFARRRREQKKVV